jgi:hypothetical protein
VVNLEPELDGVAPALGLDDGLHVRFDVVHAALELVRDRPQLAGLLEVVDVLGEPDLVDAALGGSLDVALDGLDRVVDRLVRRPEVHVVVDDQSQLSTNARSLASVILTNWGSPATMRTRPPCASTSAAQSLASAPVASARRRASATNACGV